jgi:hypothetical protein
MSNKSLLTHLGEALDTYRANHHTASSPQLPSFPPGRQARWRHWLLPTPGNVLFTCLAISSLLWVQSAGAITLVLPSAAAASTSTIPYQGRLANNSGQPLTQTVTMIFRLYSVAGGGTPLWEEPWTGPNSVQVSDGLFNVMLGSLTPIPPAVITGNSNLFLGITVGTDSEMSPRVQLGSVPFATQALTVPDGSITTSKLASDLLVVHSASTVTEYWTAPQCNGTDIRATSQWQQISGLQTSFTLDKARKVLLDFSGMGKNPGANEAIYTNIFIDGNPITVASGAPLLGGCTNSNASGQPWCTVANSATATLPAGAHTVDVRAFCDGAAADAQIYSGSLRVVVLP